MKRFLCIVALLLLFATISQAVPPQTRVVCKSSTECDYTEPADAVASITDSAADKPYTVFVYPGIYTKPITMKSYIGIVGYDQASTYLLGTDDDSYIAINIPKNVTGTSFRGLTIGNSRPFVFGSDDDNPITTTVEDCTVGIFAGPVQEDSSTDCWYDGSSSSAGHIVYANNVRLNVSSDCIMPAKNGRFTGRNLTVFTAAGGSTNAFIRPGGLAGGWHVDIDGIQHVATITGGTDYLFRWPAAVSQTYGGPVLKIRNAVWNVTTTGTVTKTQSCVNIAAAAPVSSTADFEFSNLDCTLTANDSSQTLYAYAIGNDADLANYRIHVQGGSITTSGPGTKADVSQAATASGFLFEMGSVRNSGTFLGSGSVSAISYHP